MINKLYSAITILALLLGINSIGGTNAFLSDSEKLGGVSLTTGSVILELWDTTGIVLKSPLFNIADAKPSDTFHKTIIVTNEGTKNFDYSFGMSNVDKTNPLCSALLLTVKQGGIEIFEGPIGKFNSLFTPFTAGLNNWEFSLGFTSSDTALMHQSCTFNLVADAHQSGSDGSWGFTDTKTLNNAVATNTWVVVSFTQDSDKHTVSFKVDNIEDYTSLDYKITYTSDGGDRGIQGTHALSSESSYEKTDQFLGSCTSGGTCTPDTGVTNLKLTIELTDSGGSVHTFEKTL